MRRSLDEDSFSVRFTPRTRGSKWSAVNIRHAERLEAAGRMHEAGLAAFHQRSTVPAGYAFESAPRELSPAHLARLRANRRAWTYFQAQPLWYRRTSAFWIVSAKKDETRLRRLETLIACSEKGEPVPPLRPRKGG